MTLFYADGRHRGSFNYQTVIRAFEIVEGPPEENTEILVEMGDALLHCYEFLPELMDAEVEHGAMSGTSTPVNDAPTSPVPITDQEFVDNSNECVYFQTIYHTFAAEPAFV